MFRKVAVCALLALGAASAASYRIELFQPSVVKGIQLAPGEYRLEVANGKVTFVRGKQSVEAPVKTQDVDKKFSATSVRYDAASITEIRLGGTKTKLILVNN
jgi:hypothetical protein